MPATLSATNILDAVLEPLGAWPPDRDPIEGEPQAFGLELSNTASVQAGIWECTPGRFTSERTGRCELMHFAAGDATITDSDGTEHLIGPGVVHFLPDGWQGTWDIRETVRKSYTIVDLTPTSS